MTKRDERDEEKQDVIYWEARARAAEGFLATAIQMGAANQKAELATQLRTLALSYPPDSDRHRWSIQLADWIEAAPVYTPPPPTKEEGDGHDAEG